MAPVVQPVVLRFKLTDSSFMFDKIMPLEEAVEGYDLFDKRQVHKVIFKL